MLYAIVILFVFSAYIVLKKYSSVYSFKLACMIVFLNIAIFASVLYISRCGNYQFPRYSIFTLDYYSYRLLSHIKIRFYDILRIKNVGFIGFIAMMPFFYITPQIKKDVLNYKTIIKNILYFLLPAFYVYFYDPATMYNIITDAYTYNTDIDRLNTYLNIINTFNTVWIIVYMLVPIKRLLENYKKSVFFIKKKQLISLCITLLSLDVICCMLFLWGLFKQTHFSIDFTNLDSFYGFNENMTLSYYYYSFLALFILVLLNITIIILTRYHGLDNIDFFSEYIVKRGMKKSNKDIYSIFHSFKNVIFAIKILSEQMKNTDDENQKQYFLDRISIVADESFNQLNSVLDSLNDPNSEVKQTNIYKCISDAINCVNTGNNIVIKNNTPDPLYALCHSISFKNAMVNILNNSVEAINLAQRENGLITIEASAEQEWIIIKVTDNGTGISKKNINKVFNSFFSTKSTISNWGVGLSYAYKVIKMFKGHICINSKEGEYTTIEIMLQRKRQ